MGQNESKEPMWPLHLKITHGRVSFTNINASGGRKLKVRRTPAFYAGAGFWRALGRTEGAGLSIWRKSMFPRAMKYLLSQLNVPQLARRGIYCDSRNSSVALCFLCALHYGLVSVLRCPSHLGLWLKDLYVAACSTPNPPR